MEAIDVSRDLPRKRIVGCPRSKKRKCLDTRAARRAMSGKEETSAYLACFARNKTLEDPFIIRILSSTVCVQLLPIGLYPGSHTTMYWHEARYSKKIVSVSRQAIQVAASRRDKPDCKTAPELRHSLQHPPSAIIIATQSNLASYEFLLRH